MSMLIITQNFFKQGLQFESSSSFCPSSSSLSIIDSFIYLILMCCFYHIGEYQLFSIMNPHVLTERQLTCGNNTACYSRVFLLRNLGFFPFPAM